MEYKRLISLISVFSFALVMAANVAVAQVGSDIGLGGTEPTQECTLRADVKVNINGNDVTFNVGDDIDKDTTIPGTSDKLGTRWSTICLLGTLNYVMNFMFYIVLVIALIFMILGGLFWVLGGQSEDQKTKGKNYITAAIVGFALALLARYIPSIVASFLGV